LAWCSSWSPTSSGRSWSDILASLASIGSLLLLIRFWRPRSVWRFEREGPHVSAPGRRLRAWMPWVTLGLIVFLWGLPQTKGFLNDTYSANVSVPALDMEVVRVPPVVAKPSPTAAVFAWNPLSATGTALLVTTAANSSSEVMARMIDAQSIVVGGAATGQLGVLVFLQSDLLSWMIPGWAGSATGADGLTWAHNRGDWQQGEQSRRAW
jgi:L-lactate permease